MSNQTLYILYIDLLTNEQDEKILDLLYFPTLRNEPAKTKFQVVDQGRTFTKRAKDVSSFISAMKSERCNEIKVMHSGLAGMETEPYTAKQIFLISPTCSIWDPTSEWDPKRQYTAHREYGTLQSSENYRRMNGITCHPSRLLTLIELNGITSLKSAYEWSKYFIQNNFPEDIFSDKIVGGGGIDIFDNEKRDYTHLTPRPDVLFNQWPKVAPLLGDKFGVLQPLMLGKKSLCESFNASLGNTEELILLPSHDQSVPYGLLHITQATMDQFEDACPSNPYMVPRDETTARRVR